MRPLMWIETSPSEMDHNIGGQIQITDRQERAEQTYMSPVSVLEQCCIDHNPKCGRLNLDGLIIGNLLIIIPEL